MELEALAEGEARVPGVTVQFVTKALTAIAAAIAVTAFAPSDSSAPASTASRAAAVVAPVTPARAYSRPLVTAVPAAPTTAAGYTKLWASIDTAEWGGADVSLSVPLADGRSVWLYGDTLSGNNGFVHSTAITQNGSLLHVSKGGAQLLPNDADGAVYWIEAGREVSPGVLAVTAAPVDTGDSGIWGFERTSKRSRVASVTVDARGDLTFAGWTGWTKAPRAFTDLTHEGNHFTYENRPHRELKLASGAMLWTVNNNWAKPQLDASGATAYAKYRPTFYAR